MKKIKTFIPIIFSLFKRKTIEKKIFFLHIPKCGGTSLTRAIQLCYGFRKYRMFEAFDPNASIGGSHLSGMKLTEYRRHILHYLLSMKEKKFVFGHTSYSKSANEKLKDEWSFITLLRNPVSRWFSQYYYNRYNKYSYWHVKEDLGYFIKTDTAKMWGRDFVRLFSECDNIDDKNINFALKSAMHNIEKFALVGSIENIADFTNEFNKLFNCSLKVPNLNKTPGKKRKMKDEVNEEIKKKVIDLCMPDIKLYNHVEGINRGKHT